MNDLKGRLQNRKKELQSMRNATNGILVVLGGALVVSIGLLPNVREVPVPDPAAIFSTNPEARSRLEQLALNAVRLAEDTRGCSVMDVSAQKRGWDMTYYAPALDGRLPESRHIEVKGRLEGASTVTVTKNEISEAGTKVPNTTLPLSSWERTTPSTARTTCPIHSRKNPAGACLPSTKTSRPCSHSPPNYDYRS